MALTPLSEKVLDKFKILNRGLPMHLTKIEGRFATVEFFDGSEGIHIVVQIEVERLENA